MSDMSEQESKERFVQGLKKAASKAREIAALTGSGMWKEIANTLDEIHMNGVKLMKMSALTRFQVLGMLDDREKRLASPSSTIQ